MRSMGRILCRLPKFKVIPSELYGKHCKNNWKSLCHPMWVLMSVIYFSSENVVVVEFLQHFLPSGLVSLQDSFGLYIFQISTADLNLYSLFLKMSIKIQASCYISQRYDQRICQSLRPYIQHKGLKILSLWTKRSIFGGKTITCQTFKTQMPSEASLSITHRVWWYPSHESQHCVSEVKSGDPVRVKPPSWNYGINEKWFDLREILNKESTVLDDRLETEYET